MRPVPQRQLSRRIRKAINITRLFCAVKMLGQAIASYPKNADSDTKRKPPPLFKDLDAYSDFLEKCKVDFENEWNRECPVGCLDEWERLRTLGAGSFGRVLLVKNRKSGHYCVMKIMEKEKLVKMKQVQHIFDERRTLNYVNFPFLVSLITSFKNFTCLFLVMPFVAGGEMFSHLRRVGKFDENLARFYAAQIVLSFEYLHNVNVIYRDLKPENILIDEAGYLKIADFGFCKVVRGRTWTLCGTPEYLAPEVILSKGHGKSVDWWTLGVLVYEMTAGISPFFSGGDTIKTYEKIVAGKFRHVSQSSLELKSFIDNLLQVDLTRRFGILKNGVSDVKSHAWFSSTEWLAILNKQVDAPFVPKCLKPGDSSNYERYAEEEIRVSSNDTYTEEFKDF